MNIYKKHKKRIHKTGVILVATFCLAPLSAQYWQQKADVQMEIDFDVTRHQFHGKQKLVYYNNSPDTLQEVFYHLYFNAFQPNSMMDVRSRTVADPDNRIGSRISALKPDEIGYHKVRSLKQDGRDLRFVTEGTILHANLHNPILPGARAEFSMEFDSQVPVQIRRSGRMNAEGVDYSMAQWYPKICAYDKDGWHPNPYIAREFYGEWGDFDVTIHMDGRYVIGATGYPEETEAAGKSDPSGYSGMRPWELASPDEGKANVQEGKKTWRWVAPMVHDFVWAADPDYKHTKRVAADGTELHFYFIEKANNEQAWRSLPSIMDRALQIMNARFGKYPYKRYSFIQGGDGGMEYPMATLITGNRSLSSLIGVSVHELLHSWYHSVLATNESLYSWMDEGFTTYAEGVVMNSLAEEGLLPGREAVEHILLGDYQRYAHFSQSGTEEPLTTHSDHFKTNIAYGVGAYSKGAIFLYQLEYIIGKENFSKGLLRYFENWKFRHPNPWNFIREMEKESGMVLDWYLEYWIGTTKTIDYGFHEVRALGNAETNVLLRRYGDMPMPIDLIVYLNDGRKIGYYIPMVIMRGEKQPDFPADEWYVVDDWPWTHPVFALQLPFSMAEIDRIQIDPSGRMADIREENNVSLISGG